MSEPRPGSTPERPVWTAEVPYKPNGLDHVMDALNLAARIITVAYTLMTAWEVAKALNPPLKVKQDLFVAAVRQKFARPADGLPELSNADRAAIYDATR